MAETDIRGRKIKIKSQTQESRIEESTFANGPSPRNKPVIVLWRSPEAGCQPRLEVFSGSVLTIPMDVFMHQCIAALRKSPRVMLWEMAQ